MAMGAAYLAQMKQNVKQTVERYLQQREQKQEKQKMLDREHQMRLGLLDVLEKQEVVDSITASDWRRGDADKLKGNILGIEMAQEAAKAKQAAKEQELRIADIESRTKANQALTGFGQA